MPDPCDVAPRPAVDFDPLSQEFARDPLPTLRRLREESPVFYSPRYDYRGIARHVCAVSCNPGRSQFRRPALHSPVPAVVASAGSRRSVSANNPAARGG